MYHAENVPNARSKAHWNHKELLVLAYEEIVVQQLGVKNINQRLVQITPNQTLEDIKGLQELLASLQQEADSSKLIKHSMSNPAPGATDDIPDDPTPGLPDHSVDWPVEVWDGINHLGVSNGIDIHAIIPGSPTR